MVTVIGLLLAFIAGFFCAIKALQLGLRWNIQSQQKQEPTLNNPIQEMVTQKQTEKANTETARIFDEWFNGKKD